MARRRRPFIKVKGFEGKDLRKIGDFLDDLTDLKKFHDTQMRGAADTATETARRQFGVNKRKSVPARRTRQTTNGNLREFIKFDYKPGRRGNISRVKLNTGLLNSVASDYWLVQEIGTGNSAQQGTVSVDGKVTRKTITIPSQVGRRLPSRLQFTSGGRFYAPTASRASDNISPYDGSEIQGARTQFASSIRIGREIGHRGFVQAGTRAGRKEYRARMRTEIYRLARKKGLKIIPKDR
jgi:hypothetical protein